MVQLNAEESLILIIDVQEKLLNAVFNKEIVAGKTAIIAKASEILGIPVIVTEQYPKGLGNTVTNLKNNLNANVLFYEKTDFSALDNKEICNAVKASLKRQIVIFGIETHICVNQTVTALIKEGYDVSVIKDACGSRTEAEYHAGLDRMKENGAHILTTEIALFEWLKGATHPKFKEVQSLIK